MDAVITFVDSSDEVWMRNLLKGYMGENGEPNDALATFINNGDTVRYNFFYDYGTLRYVLRGIEKFMPYTENVFLAVSNIEQVPEYVDTSRVIPVIHKDFIPEKFLPTYNSTTIEMFLNRIPGLGNEFVYFNDDMIPVGRIDYGDLFRDGIPCINFEENRRDPRYMTYKHCNISFWEAKNSVEMMTGKDTGYSGPVMCPVHSPVAMLKPVMDEYAGQDRFGSMLDFYVTNTRKGRNLTQYYWSDILFFLKRYVQNDDLTLKYVWTYELDHFDTRSMDGCKYLCINDSAIKSRPLSETGDMICSLLNSILPEKCGYEK